MHQQTKSLLYIGQHGSWFDFMRSIPVYKDDMASLEELTRGVELLRKDDQHHDPYVQHYGVYYKEYYLKECFLALHKKSAPEPQKEPLEDHFNEVSGVLKNKHGLFMRKSLSYFREILSTHGQNKAIVRLLEDSILDDRKFELGRQAAGSLSLLAIESVLGKSEVRKMRRDYKAANASNIKPQVPKAKQQ